MANLDNLGVIVVVLMLAGIIVVSFVVTPDAKEKTSLEASGRKLAAASRLRAGESGRPAADSELMRRRRVSAKRAGALITPPPPGHAGQAGASPRARPEHPGSPSRGAKRTRRFDLTPERLPGTRPVRLKAPGGAAARPSEHAPSAPAQRLAARGFPKKVKIAAGDSLWMIAVRQYGARLGASMAALIARQNGIKNDRHLKVGSLLTLPVPPAALLARLGRRPETGEKTAAFRPPRRSEGAGLAFLPEPQDFAGERKTSARPGGSYTVREGDTLGAIAIKALGSMRYVKAIKKLNRLKNENLIRPGMVLKLPRK